MSAETFINVEGQLLNASLQPPYPDLQAAFRARSGKIVIDMDAARDVARNMVRRVRNEQWARVDADRARAIEDGVGMDVVRARSAALRAAPQDARIDEAKTPGDLLTAVHVIEDELTRV